MCNQIQCTAVQLRNYVFEKLNAQTSFNKNSLNVFPVSYGGTEIKDQKNIEVFFADQKCIYEEQDMDRISLLQIYVNSQKDNDLGFKIVKQQQSRSKSK